MNSYPQLETLEPGSNSYIQIQDAIGEFEIFLTALEDKEIKIDSGALTYKDFLFFITGSDRISPHGFDKQIEIHFDDVSLPKSATCGSVGTFPYQGQKDKFRIACQFGGGFGVI